MKIRLRHNILKAAGVLEKNVASEAELSAKTWKHHKYSRTFNLRLTIRVPTIYAFLAPTPSAYVHLAWVLSAYLPETRVRSIISALGGDTERAARDYWCFEDDIPF